MEKKTKCVNLYENESQSVVAAIDKIVVEVFNRRELGQSGQTILMTGCSPLAGTTSTCIGLAIAMANSRRKTLLIDCDMRKTVKYKKLNEQVSEGLYDFLSEDSIKSTMDFEDVIYETNIENLSYIPCGSAAENATRLLCSAMMEQLVAIVRQDYDCVILDFPSITIVPDAQILFRNVDGIILLSALGETRKKQIKEAKLKISSNKDKYYGMIVNKVPLDMYRMNARDFDYYFLNRKGEQKLKGSVARKKYKKESVHKGGN